MLVNLSYMCMCMTQFIDMDWIYSYNLSRICKHDLETSHPNQPLQIFMHLTHKKCGHCLRSHNYYFFKQNNIILIDHLPIIYFDSRSPHEERHRRREKSGTAKREEGREKVREGLGAHQQGAQVSAQMRATKPRCRSTEFLSTECRRPQVQPGSEFWTIFCPFGLFKSNFKGSTSREPILSIVRTIFSLSWII